jgi:hypothetical protein
MNLHSLIILFGGGFILYTSEGIKNNETIALAHLSGLFIFFETPSILFLLKI